MNLLQVRTQFVKLSGRYDLVTDAAGDDYTDNGANFFIQEGQKLLDQLVKVPENIAKIYLPLAINGYYINWDKETRSIEKVWVNDAEDRWELEKLTLDEFKAKYADSTTDTVSGTVEHYAIAEIRALETTSRDSLATFLNYTRDESDTDYTDRTILIGPPTDTALVVEVSGKFHQLILSGDTDENFWSIRYPGVLLQCALYQLEVFSRGTENAKNWLSAIKTAIMEIEKDSVEEEVSDIDNMEG